MKISDQKGKNIPVLIFHKLFFLKEIPSKFAIFFLYKCVVRDGFFSIFENIFSVYLGFSILFIYEDINLFWNLNFHFFFKKYYYLGFFLILCIRRLLRCPPPITFRDLSPPSITRRLLICLYQFLSINFFISIRFYQIISINLSLSISVY